MFAVKPMSSRVRLLSSAHLKFSRGFVEEIGEDEAVAMSREFVFPMILHEI